LGRRNRAFYRLRAADSRDASTGRFIEDLGYVDPVLRDENKQTTLRKDRIEHWLKRGATTSNTVRRLLKKNGIAAAAATG
jgi:small subunit ribosomal protein S16